MTGRYADSYYCEQNWDVVADKRTSQSIRADTYKKNSCGNLTMSAGVEGHSWRYCIVFKVWIMNRK